MREIVHEIATTAINKGVLNGEKWQPDLTKPKYAAFLKKQGAFTTLYSGTKSNKRLRGCIGVPNPIYKLGKAIAHSAYSAALTDPRFPSVVISELDSLLMSVEILSPIEEIQYSSLEQLKSEINLGEDGLIIEHENQSGLLLPKVPTEYNWDMETYLKQICAKAMLPISVLEKCQAKISKFSSQLFKFY